MDKFWARNKAIWLEREGPMEADRRGGENQLVDAFDNCILRVHHI